MINFLAELPLVIRCVICAEIPLKADMCGAKRHVRYTPDNDRESEFLRKVTSALPRCSLNTNAARITIHLSRVMG